MDSKSDQNPAFIMNHPESVATHTLVSILRKTREDETETTTIELWGGDQNPVALKHPVVLKMMSPEGSHPWMTVHYGFQETIRCFMVLKAVKNKHSPCVIHVLETDYTQTKDKSPKIFYQFTFHTSLDATLFLLYHNAIIENYESSQSIFSCGP